MLSFLEDFIYVRMLLHRSAYIKFLDFGQINYFWFDYFWFFWFFENKFPQRMEFYVEVLTFVEEKEKHGNTK